MAGYEFSLNGSLLSSLGIVWPAHQFSPGSEDIQLANGGVVTVGWIQSSWHWDYLEKSQYDILRTFCPGKSADITIRTLNQENIWKNYTGKMIWPTVVTHSNSKVLDFTLNFRALVEVVP
jgi:hypothetical protein